MNQLYARVFTQILDSSLADNWQARHVFEDMLKLTHNGILDMTRQAIARRTAVPIEVVNAAIDYLEAPDPASRDPEEEGRRLLRLDPHRDWGWTIVNWEKYEGIRSSADQRAQARERKRRQRDLRGQEKSPSALPLSKTESEAESEDAGQNVTCHAESRSGRDNSAAKAASPQKFIRPNIEDVKLETAKIGLPDAEAEKFHNFYESNGWRVGKNPMRSWRHALINWKIRNEQSSENQRSSAPVKSLREMSNAEILLGAI